MAFNSNDLFKSNNNSNAANNNSVNAANNLNEAQSAKQKEKKTAIDETAKILAELKAQGWRIETDNPEELIELEKEALKAVRKQLAENRASMIERADRSDAGRETTTNAQNFTAKITLQNLRKKYGHLITQENMDKMQKEIQEYLKPRKYINTVTIVDRVKEKGNYVNTFLNPTSWGYKSFQDTYKLTNEFMAELTDYINAHILNKNPEYLKADKKPTLFSVKKIIKKDEPDTIDLEIDINPIQVYGLKVTSKYYNSVNYNSTNEDYKTLTNNVASLGAMYYSHLNNNLWLSDHSWNYLKDFKVHEVFYLWWLAAKDETVTTSTVENRKLAFARALEETYRGHNRDNNIDIDNGAPSSRMSCAIGFKNKMAESFKEILNAAHPDNVYVADIADYFKNVMRDALIKVVINPEILKEDEIKKYAELLIRPKEGNKPQEKTADVERRIKESLMFIKVRDNEKQLNEKTKEYAELFAKLYTDLTDYDNDTFEALKMLTEIQMIKILEENNINEKTSNDWDEAENNAHRHFVSDNRKTKWTDIQKWIRDLIITLPDMEFPSETIKVMEEKQTKEAENLLAESEAKEKAEKEVKAKNEKEVRAQVKILQEFVQNAKDYPKIHERLKNEELGILKRIQKKEFESNYSDEVQQTIYKIWDIAKIKKAEYEAAERKRAEEARQKALEEARRKALEEERKRKEEEARRAEERRKEEELDALRQIEAYEKKVAEEKAKEELEKQKRAQDKEAKELAQALEAIKKLEQLEAKKKADEEAQRKKTEEEARKKANTIAPKTRQEMEDEQLRLTLELSLKESMKDLVNKPKAQDLTKTKLIEQQKVQDKKPALVNDEKSRKIAETELKIAAYRVELERLQAEVKSDAENTSNRNKLEIKQDAEKLAQLSKLQQIEEAHQARKIAEQKRTEESQKVEKARLEKQFEHNEADIREQLRAIEIAEATASPEARRQEEELRQQARKKREQEEIALAVKMVMIVQMKEKEKEKIHKKQKEAMFKENQSEGLGLGGLEDPKDKNKDKNMNQSKNNNLSLDGLSLDPSIKNTGKEISISQEKEKRPMNENIQNDSLTKFEFMLNEGARELEALNNSLDINLETEKPQLTKNTISDKETKNNQGNQNFLEKETDKIQLSLEKRIEINSNDKDNQKIAENQTDQLFEGIKKQQDSENSDEDALILPEHDPDQDWGDENPDIEKDWDDEENDPFSTERKKKHESDEENNSELEKESVSNQETKIELEKQYQAEKDKQTQKEKEEHARKEKEEQGRKEAEKAKEALKGKAKFILNAQSLEELADKSGKIVRFIMDHKEVESFKKEATQDYIIKYNLQDTDLTKIDPKALNRFMTNQILTELRICQNTISQGKEYPKNATQLNKLMHKAINAFEKPKSIKSIQAEMSEDEMLALSLANAIPDADIGEQAKLLEEIAKKNNAKTIASSLL